MATVLDPGPAEGRTALSDTYDADLARFGDRLRRAREHRGLTLEDVANETKIPQRHLEALEEGHLGAKAAGFYQRAEIRAYAKAVGLDQQMVLAQLDSALKPVDPAPAPEVPSTQPRFSRAHALIALCVVTPVAAVYLVEGALTRSTPSVETRSAPQQTQLPAPPVDNAIPVVTARSAQPDLVVQAAETAAVTSQGPQPPADAGNIPPSGHAVTELVVTTEPTGARVTVNGIGWGTSPVTIRHLPPGDKRVRVTMEGYAPVERLVPVGEGGRRALDIRLSNEP